MPVPKNGGKLAFDVARLLDQDSIPNVLWGWLGLSLVASDQGNREVEFVIPDNQIDDARKSLATAGFTVCTNPKCPELCEDRFPEDQWRPTFRLMGIERQNATVGAITSFDRYHPVAAAHYHVERQSAEYRILSLHRKSSQLWWLPELKTGPPSSDDRNLTLSNSSRLPTGKGRSGPWTDQYPIKVLLPWAFLEAVMLLRCRDYGHTRGLHLLWNPILYLFCPHDEELRDKIHPRFRLAWDSLNDRRPEGEMQWLKMRHLRTSLIQAGELPDIPQPNNADRFV
ncbi:hypothetical protein BDW74DRAFT_113054 [Aspergillus multicolor]|uniref:uncharacterized protein n=1 Tax=Aspergillus multicolor TaxID=41759 RepID=UPI003CCCD920